MQADAASKNKNPAYFSLREFVRDANDTTHDNPPLSDSENSDSNEHNDHKLGCYETVQVLKSSAQKSEQDAIDEAIQLYLVHGKSRCVFCRYRKRYKIAIIWLPFQTMSILYERSS